MATSGLSAAGSSTYSSNTLHVGDGTWDSSRDDFLLPNLMGLNFATMRYNGMGNRFRDLPEYHQLILGHGVLAAITFLGLLPAAIFIAKFGVLSPRWNVKLHVYLQILVVFLSTVILILGYFAVGPERSLTNPHHGIGVAIYVCILVQFLYGTLMARMEKNRKTLPTRVPTKVWLHKLFGRSIALIAIIQIALGLTLYGSPKVLFVLYALTAFFLLSMYLILDRYYYEKQRLDYWGGGQPEFYSDYGSYLSGTRTDFTQDQRPGPPGQGDRRDDGRERSHFGRDALAAVGALGAYEAFRRRRSDRREEREQMELDAERRQGRPPLPASGMAPSGFTQSGVSSRPNSRPPPPGVTYGAGGVPTHGGGGPPRRRVSTEESRVEDSRLGDSRLNEGRISAQSWEDEKYSQPPQRRHTWRDRFLGAGAGIGAYEGVKSLFNRRRRRDDEGYDDDYSRPTLGGAQNMVSQTDVSRVQNGQAPGSPNTPRRQGRLNMAGTEPMTPSATPSRPPRGARPSGYPLSYDDEESVPGGGVGAGYTPPRNHDDNHTLRNSIATLGAIAGFREWNNRRRERREEQRAERLRRQDAENEDLYNRRHSNTYPRPQDVSGRRPSLDDTVLTGATQEQGNPEAGAMHNISDNTRTNFNNGQSGAGVDTSHPPLPLAAGRITDSGSGAGIAPSTVGPSVSQQRFDRVDETGGAPQGYSIPPPPPGPPPGGYARPQHYGPPEPGSLQMPSGAIEPDPGRLLSSENVASGQQHGGNHQIRNELAAAGVGAAAAGIASENRQRRRNSQSESPSRYNTRQDSRNRLQRRPERRGSVTSGSVSQLNTANVSSAAGPTAGPSSPPVAVKVNMHPDGRHVTLRRLNEEEQAAEHAQRRRDRQQRRQRRGSSFSSGGETELPPGSNQRYRRNGGPVRRSSEQPIMDVPPPPAMSSSALGAPSSHRPPSELNLPPPIPSGQAGRIPQHTESPAGDGLSPPTAPMHGSGLSAGGNGGFGSPGDAGTGTDVSNFADNRRRRRAERARKLEAARGAGQRVAFDE